MTTLIGISGKPGAVKMQYAFKIIQELRFHGYRTDLVALAAPLYGEIHEIIDDVNAGDLDEKSLCAKHGLPFTEGETLISLIRDGLGERHPDYGYSRRNENMRKALSLLGGAIRREQDCDYWIDKLVARLTDDVQFAVFCDLRFPNEADYINAHGGVSLRAEIIETIPAAKDDYKYQAGLKDPTETALDHYLDFYAYLYPRSFERVNFGLELLEYFGLPVRKI